MKNATGHIAKLTIHGLDTAKLKDQVRIANWLRHQAINVETAFEGEFSKRYTARLMK